MLTRRLRDQDILRYTKESTATMLVLRQPCLTCLPTFAGRKLLCDRLGRMRTWPSEGSSGAGRGLAHRRSRLPTCRLPTFVHDERGHRQSSRSPARCTRRACTGRQRTPMLAGDEERERVNERLRADGTLTPNPCQPCYPLSCRCVQPIASEMGPIPTSQVA